MIFQEKRIMYVAAILGIVTNVAISYSINSKDEVIYPSSKDNREECLISAISTGNIDSVENTLVHIPNLSEPFGFSSAYVQEQEKSNISEKIELIEPPLANRMGSVSLSYELEMTPAKNSMFPSFRITYDSDRNSELLGEGWTLDEMKITVDTTHGIPDYTEKCSYFLNGVKIKDVIQSGDSTLFLTVRNANFLKVIRYGSKASDYRWIVIGRDGRKYYYGIEKDEDLVGVQKGIVDKDTVIAEWKISRIEDTYGNYVRYEYKDIVEPNGNVLYLDTVFVGSKDAEPHSIAIFNFEEKMDSVISQEGYGFTLSTTHLLTGVDIKMEKPEEEKTKDEKFDLVRSYVFQYKAGHGKSKVLKNLVHKNEVGVSFTHLFEYYDDVDSVISYKKYRDETKNASVDSAIIDRTSKIRSVHNPLGGCFTIDYAYSELPDTLGKIVLQQTDSFSVDTTVIDPFDEELATDSMIDIVSSDSIYDILPPDTVSWDSIKGKLVMSYLRINDAVFDDGVNTINKFIYSGGKCDSLRGEFLGFESFVIQNINTETDTVYRIQIHDYDMSNEATVDNLMRVRLMSPDSSRVYEEFNLNYNYYLLSSSDWNGVIMNEDSSLLVTLDTFAYMPLKYKRHTIAGEASDVNFYEYTSDFGLLKSVKYSGTGSLDRNGEGSFDRQILFQYENDLELHLFNLISRLTVKDAKEKEYLDWKMTYSDKLNPSLVTKLEQKKDASKYVSTQFEYDESGNMISRVLPPNQNGEKMTYKYLYDRRYNMYPERVENSFGYRSEYEDYNYHYGVACTVRDRNGFEMHRTLDKWGRIDTILAPNEQDANVSYSIAFAYGLPQKKLIDSSTERNFNDTLILNVPEKVYTNFFQDAVKKKIIGDIRAIKDTVSLDRYNICHSPWVYDTFNIIVAYDSLLMPFCYCSDYISPGYVKTTRYDAFCPNDKEYKMVSFVDGFGRIIQDQRDGKVMTASAESGTKTEQKMSIVSGKVIYDSYSRAVSIYYPTTQSSMAYSEKMDEIDPLKIEYDELDRETKFNRPSGDSLLYSYSVSDGKINIELKEPLGVIHKIEKNMEGRMLKWTKPQASDLSSVLTYAYDPLNRLISSKINGAESSWEYDLKGNLVKTNHPLQGQTNYQYDDAGNLLSKQNAVLKSENQSITYKYEYDRLLAVNYPNYPENNVTYIYGDKNASENRVGLLSMQVDATGAQEYYYGRLGEVTKVRRTIVVPNNTIETYETEWKYDTWNKLGEIIYPDGEKITYQYNEGGYPEVVQGEKAYTYKYVNKIGYDKFGNRVYMKYCNGDEMFYSYHPKMLYMQNSQVWANVQGSPRRKIMEDNSSYTRETGADLTLSFKEASYGSHYELDAVGRISYTFINYVSNSESLDTSASYYALMKYDGYDLMSSLKKEFSQNNLQMEGSSSIYYDCSIESESPYRLSVIKNSSASAVNPLLKESLYYDYDGNGNVARLSSVLKPSGSETTEMQGGNSDRSMFYDEENRMFSLNDNGYVNLYWYDAQGNRVVKMSGGNECVYVNSNNNNTGYTDLSNYYVYVNPYMEKDETGMYIKNIMLDEDVIVTKIGDAESYGSDPKRIARAGSDAPETTVSYESLYETAQKSIEKRYDAIEVPYFGTMRSYPKNESLRNANVGKENDNYEEQQFYYHFDRDGNVVMLTDLKNNITQRVVYTISGELFINEKNEIWNTSRLFRGNLYDEETGLYFMKHGYYDPAHEIIFYKDTLSRLFKSFVNTFIESNQIKW